MLIAKVRWYVLGESRTWESVAAWVLGQLKSTKHGPFIDHDEVALPSDLERAKHYDHSNRAHIESPKSQVRCAYCPSFKECFGVNKFIRITVVVQWTVNRDILISYKYLNFYYSGRICMIK